ncbi:MAG: hypothetical protein ACOYJY_04740 [Acutalibacteraceae bacterium]|jgi:hypothetical protein
MNTTLFVYIAMGVLTVVPLILYNIRKIWVRQEPSGVKFNPARCAVIGLIAVLLVAFLIGGYRATLRNRYEIALERLATAHAEVVTGQRDEASFWRFVQENGTDAVADDLQKTALTPSGTASSARFQLSSACRPQFWRDQPAFEQAPVASDDDPLYLLYRLEVNGRESLFAVRMGRTADGWRYEWFGAASEEQAKIIGLPSAINGKWYAVSKKGE